MNEKRHFGELESFILQNIKKKKKASVSDIHSFLKDEVAYTTILTVMNRLYKKSILKREKSGRNFIYWISNPNYFSNTINRIKEKIFGGSAVDMVSYLIENSSEITNDELNKIDALITKMQKAQNKKNK